MNKIAENTLESEEVLLATWNARLREFRAEHAAVAARMHGKIYTLRGLADLRRVREKHTSWNGEVLLGESLPILRHAVRVGVAATTHAIVETTLADPVEPDAPTPLAATLARLRSVRSAAELGDIDLRALAGDLLHWDSPEKPRTTAPVVRAIGRIMTGSVERSHEGETLVLSRWSQAVEMLSYAAAFSPLLEPDAISRVIELALETPNAHAPIPDPIKASETLMTLLGRYQSARREQMIVSLWNTAHGPRWWMRTSAMPLDVLRDGVAAAAPAPAPAPRGRELNHEGRRRQQAEGLWKEGSLDASFAGSTSATWWAQRSDLLAQAVALHGAEFLAAVRDQAAKVEQSEIRSGRAGHRSWYSGGYMLPWLRGESPLPGGARSHESALVYPHLDPDAQQQFLEALEENPRARGGDDWYRRQRMETFLAVATTLSTPERQRIHTALPLVQWRRDTALHGVCDSTQFQAVWDVTFESERITLLSSPRASARHHKEVLERVRLSPRPSLMELAVLVENWHRLNRADRLRLGTGFTPPVRALLMAHLPTEHALELIKRERDESVLAEALSRLLTLETSKLGAEIDKLRESPRQRSVEELALVGKPLSRRISRWSDAKDVIEALGTSGAVETIDLEALGRQIVAHRLAGREVQAFIAGAERIHATLPVDLYRHALSVGAVPAGSTGTTALIATGTAEAHALTLTASSDRDEQVSASYSPGLAPSERRVSPLDELIDELSELELDREPGVERIWPKKPRHWGELHAAVGVGRFRIPAAVRATFEGELPEFSGSTLSMVHSDGALRENANQMGNCTYSYLSRIKAGNALIGRVEIGREIYNFALRREIGRSGISAYRLGEVNSRYNRYNLPAGLQESLGRKVEELNALLAPATLTPA